MAAVLVFLVMGSSAVLLALDMHETQRSQICRPAPKYTEYSGVYYSRAVGAFGTGAGVGGGLGVARGTIRNP